MTPSDLFLKEKLNSQTSVNKLLNRRSYVIYANGSVKSTGKLYFFNHYPILESQNKFFVSNRDSNKELSAQKLLGLTSNFLPLVTILLKKMNLYNLQFS